MMIYGYQEKVINEYGLLQLKEVTFATNAEDLRTIARFLLAMADGLDTGAFEGCSHQHISSVVEGWSKTHADVDIVVMPPVRDTNDDGGDCAGSRKRDGGAVKASKDEARARKRR